MKVLPKDEFSVFLDALLRTVLESQYGRNCWTFLKKNTPLLLESAQLVLKDPELWRDLSRRVRLAECAFEEARREPYLRKVAKLFAERAACRFRIPMPRIDPRPWDEERIQRWRQGRNLLGILTGPETLPIVETIKAIEEGRVGIPTSGRRVIGAPGPEWIAPSGSVSGGVITADNGKPHVVNFGRAVRIDTALILSLPRANEINLHRRLTQEAQAAGVKILNPASSASEAADRKHLAHTYWRRAGVETPTWRFIPARFSRDRVQRALLRFAEQNGDNRCVYILPDDSTEGDRIRRFVLTSENLEPASKHITESIHPTGDALIRRECGNIRFMLNREPRRAVLRLNVNHAPDSGWSFAGCWHVAGDSSSDVASVGRGGTLAGLSESRESLVASVDSDWIPVPSEVWNPAELTALAQCAARALQGGLAADDCLSFVGLDFLPSWRPGDPSLRWSVLEANARPAGLGAAEPL